MLDETNRDEKRLTIRSLAKLASEVVAQYWPIGTFVHHNPLHELENLNFFDAVDRVHEILGARRFLPKELYRQRLENGEIEVSTVDAVLSETTNNTSITVAGRIVDKLSVRREILIHGIELPSKPQLQCLWDIDPEQELLDGIVSSLKSSVSTKEIIASQIASAVFDIGGSTLIGWVDKTLGTDLEAKLNKELSRWCATFLDEGEAGWSMPDRRQGFYACWKAYSRLVDLSQWGPELRSFSNSLPDRPEDAIVELLERLHISEDLATDYFAAQFSSLPGWASFIKWRSSQQGYAWQLYPIDLVQYLAVRLAYECSMLSQICKKDLGIEGNYYSIKAFIEKNPLAYILLKQKNTGQLTETETRLLDRAMQSNRRYEEGHLLHADSAFLKNVADRIGNSHLQSLAWRLRGLCRLLNINIAELSKSKADDLLTLSDWLDEFSDKEQGIVWLKVCEEEFQQSLINELSNSAKQHLLVESKDGENSRPQAQAVFCIDVRCEPFRRHLESVGRYETLGFAGFFNCFIRYKPLDSACEKNQFPVVMKARNMVREIPRPYHQAKMAHYQRGRNFLKAVREVLHSLKANVITPYVTVESLGWAYAFPFVLKTFMPTAYSHLGSWFRHSIQEPISTSLTVDKLGHREAAQMVRDTQLSVIREFIMERFKQQKSQINPESLDTLRRLAMGELDISDVDTSGLPEHDKDKLTLLVEELRAKQQISPRGAATHLERLTRTGFTLAEQVFTIETSLRMMGLINNFARIVLICAHGSKSDNNPFESALDCGACGGNEGQANARVFAAMANKLDVRNELARKGIDIPVDTYFLAGQYCTTNDTVELLDLEDVPPTHRMDLARLTEDLMEAGILSSQERCSRLPDIGGEIRSRAGKETWRRSCDWSQVRPEWGLSSNAAFIIGRRGLSAPLNLQGRVFLNSYDHTIDTDGKLLENLLTAAQTVCEWINMEHYFSTVDNDVFGAGSKIYHNVTSHVGVMSGTLGDLRIGLPEQTVMKGETNYHDPLRLTTIVEAPRERIEMLISRHEVLQRFYHNEWVHLVAVAPDDGVLYKYLPNGEWKKLQQQSATSSTESVGNNI
ncbi:MAG: DUF2309 domain-containing protein [Candidatus Obscuribacterales bacterium]|nr:DUF2309 domain-containing protein [Candidatus Obscuribacterales bacterium]